MNAPHATQESIVLLHAEQLDEIVRRIRKLRWAGLEREAEALQAALRGLDVADCVLAEPLDTD